MSVIDTSVFHPTRTTFIAIFDAFGCIQEVYPELAVLDDVFRECERLDRCGDEYSPHTAWEHREGEWYQLKDRVHRDAGRFLPGRSVKVPVKKPAE